MIIKASSQGWKEEKESKLISNFFLDSPSAVHLCLFQTGNKVDLEAWRRRKEEHIWSQRRKSEIEGEL